MSADTVPGGREPSESTDRAGSGVPTHDGSIHDRARQVLEAAWRPRGFTVPNRSVYPHQWLWDSCFHAVVWAHLGEPDRAVSELTAALAHQHASGFVPHLTYWEDPSAHESFWGRAGTSTITQPPMYGHALAELVRAGVALPDELVARVEAGLAFLLGPRRGPRALVPIVHPWESGCDDSPRWDGWAGTPRTPAGWFERKGELVAALVLDDHGAALGSAAFEVESAAFNALVAFNVAELLDVGLGRALAPETGEVVAELDGRWDGAATTWSDAPIGSVPVATASTDGASAAWSSSARTLEALLPVLVTGDEARADDVFAQVHDPSAFGGPFGPAQVHRGEAAFDPDAYWRGPTWPQLAYLLWVAARRRDRSSDAAALAAALVAGADRSGFAEYWNPDTGEGHGAAPQSWTALVAVVADPA